MKEARDEDMYDNPTDARDKAVRLALELNRRSDLPEWMLNSNDEENE